jgi:hypothetical protein
MTIDAFLITLICFRNNGSSEKHQQVKFHFIEAECDLCVVLLDSSTMSSLLDSEWNEEVLG